MNPYDAPKPVLSVTQLNNQARLLLERNFAQVAVEGELAGVRTDGAGHTWFSLKDRTGVCAAVLFRGNARGLRMALKDGLQVVARGRLTVYAATGRYQLVVSDIEAQGAGALQAAFEALKARLSAEGLFAAERKRTLPLLPRRVAVITSPTGAVIRDIVNVSHRRYPNCRIVVVPCRVQGADCAPSVVAALHKVAACAATLAIDVVIVARGGGSLDDLWGFNDEQVARAIAASPVPVVSAVGHETDFTIADFVADLRAPTPSAAAEMVFARKSELTARLARLADRARQATVRRLHAQRLRMRALRAELGDGRRPLLLQAQHISRLSGRLTQALQERTRKDRARVAGLSQKLHGLHPRVRLVTLARRIVAVRARLAAQRSRAVDTRRRHLHAAMQRLHDLSPLAVLGRGYAIVATPEHTLLRRAEDAPPGTRLHVRLGTGALWAVADKEAPAFPEAE